MKRTTLLFFAVLIGTASLLADTGWYNDFLTIKVNGVETTNNYYLSDSNPASGATALHGANFGIVTTLEITACDMKYWSDTQDRTGGAFYYEIKSSDGSTQIAAPVEVIWDQTVLGGNDFQGTKITSINITNSILANGTYQLVIWAKSWGTGQGDSWLSNSGANYVATFTVSRPVIVSGANGIVDNTSYGTLKAAFDAINAQPDQTAKDIEIQIAGNTTETASAALTQPTTASWNSLTIYPTSTGVKINGDFASNLIDLNGADKVTINGRLNKIGESKNLTIENTKSADNAARTIRLWNDAKLNTITHCIIKGSCPSSGAGVVFIGSGLATTGTGNDENTISFNDFNKAGTVSPYSSIYSAGTSGMANDKNVIEYNNFFNLFAGSTSYAIRVGSNSSEFTIRNNNIYEPNEIIPTAANTYYGISITGTGENFTITNNFIGGSGPACTGLFKKSNAFSNDFVGIFVSTATGATNTTNIQGNFIKNIEWKNASVKKDFVGFNSFGKMVDIGTTEANTISNITWENGAISGGVFYGFNVINSEGLHTLQNNSITDITINNTDAAHGSNFFGIFKSNSAGSVSILNNRIGGTATNSINVTGTSTANSQIVAGVNCNYVSGTARVYSFAITGNTIQNMNNGSNRTDITNSVYGIYTNPTTGSGTINANTIKNLTSSDATNPARIIGINLDVTSTSTPTICSNNMITLGNNNPGLVFGILQNTGLGKIYHNSVYLAGSPVAGSFESSALNATGSTAGRELINNILVNTRSNDASATSKHYSLKIQEVASLSSDYNVLNVTGTGGMPVAVSTTDYPTLGAYQSANPTLDVNSKSVNVNFVDANAGDLRITGDSEHDDHLAVPLLASVSTDMYGTSRAAYTYAGAHHGAMPFYWTGIDKSLSAGSSAILRTTTGIEINLNKPTAIELYTSNGVLIDKTMANGNYIHTLNNGIYIVRINGVATKFVK